MFLMLLLVFLLMFLLQIELFPKSVVDVIAVLVMVIAGLFLMWLSKSPDEK